jgi:hypothetical protein
MFHAVEQSIASKNIRKMEYFGMFHGEPVGVHRRSGARGSARTE